METFHRGVKAYNDGDLDGVLDGCDEEIDFLPLRSAIEGPYRGHAGIRKWWADTAVNWQTFEVEADEIRDLGDGRIAASGVIHAQGKGGGVPLDIPTSFLTEMRDARTVRQEWFFDRDEAFEKVGLRRAPRPRSRRP
jgi:ketosteroid isomerase-like protein